MAFKLVAFATLVAAANAGVLPVAPLAYVPAGHYVYAAPIAKEAAVPEAKAHEVEYNHHPEYTYSYDVHDVHTGDAKKLEESRHGDAVKGSYSLIEADGSRRIVHYTADDVHGFNAVVHKEPAAHPVKHIAAVPIVHAAPIAHAAPEHYAPVARVAKYSDATLASHVSYKTPDAYYSH